MRWCSGGTSDPSAVFPNMKTAGYPSGPRTPFRADATGVRAGRRGRRTAVPEAVSSGGRSSDAGVWGHAVPGRPSRRDASVCGRPRCPGRARPRHAPSRKGVPGHNRGSGRPCRRLRRPDGRSSPRPAISQCAVNRSRPMHARRWKQRGPAPASGDFCVVTRRPPLASVHSVHFAACTRGHHPAYVTLSSTCTPRSHTPLFRAPLRR